MVVHGTVRRNGSGQMIFPLRISIESNGLRVNARVCCDSIDAFMNVNIL